MTRQPATVYSEEHDSASQRVNLQNEWPTQMTVDSCGEWCAQLNDFRWFLPTDERAEDLSTPESGIDTSEVNVESILLIQTRLLYRRSRRLSGCYALWWSFRRDLRRAATQQCPGDCVRDVMSGGGQYGGGGCQISVRRFGYSSFSEDT